MRVRTIFMGSLSVFAMMGHAETISPSYPLARYEALMEKSPFVKEAPFASMHGSRVGEDLIITGHFRIGEVIYVNVLNKKTQERMSLSSEEKNSANPKVLSLSDENDPYKVNAVIQVGGETASIGFERPAPPKAAGKQPGNANSKNSMAGDTQNTGASIDKSASAEKSGSLQERIRSLFGKVFGKN